MKLLSVLLERLVEESGLLPVVSITAIANNSRDVVVGSLFIAYPGEKSDGRNYILDAIQKGVAAVVYDPANDFALPLVSVPCIPVDQLKTKQAEIAARFYDFPSQKIPVIGVTGTNGKTSVTHFLAQTLSCCAVIGTVGYGFLSDLRKTANTTPDGLQLQKIFSTLSAQGAKAIAMEVSSHALSQRRVDNVLFHTAVFTNLTQDHLDYHRTMENYRSAKEKLFQQPGLKNAVINIDDIAGYYFSQKYANKLNVITYSKNSDADISVLMIRPQARGFVLNVKTPWGVGELNLPLVGEFNIDNALATIGVLGLLGVSFDQIVEKVSVLKTVAGRMEVLHVENKPTVVVDYAHTPDALEKALESVRAHCSGKVICVFGCGGDRDKTKRPKMGAIADHLSDYIVITNDNPRTEDALLIAQEIVMGFVDFDHFLIELDREKAIAKAIGLAEPDDWVLVAGKGHETEQVIADQVLHHSDIECVKKCLGFVA